MKRALPLAVIMCLASWFASAQAPAARSAQANSDEATIRHIEREWINALLKADTAALDRIEAADFVFTDPDGQMHTKAHHLADFKSGALKFESITLNDMKVRIFGDAAIVHGMTTEKSSYKGKDTSGQYRWVRCFRQAQRALAGRGRPWQQGRAALNDERDLSAHPRIGRKEGGRHLRPRL